MRWKALKKTGAERTARIGSEMQKVTMKRQHLRVSWEKNNKTTRRKYIETEKKGGNAEGKGRSSSTNQQCPKKNAQIPKGKTIRAKR